jgi:hypothetical protein
MLKEVGTSGQISLGKKYAGQLFDVATQLDGSIVITPVKVVPITTMVSEAQPVWGQPAKPINDSSTREWAEANAANIDQYNAWASQREPYSQRVRRWRESGQNGQSGEGNA